MRYMIAVRAASRPPPAPPGPAWVRVHAGGRATIWTLGAYAGAPLDDGFRLGATRRPIRAWAEIASTWGGYIAVRETPGDVRIARDATGREPAYWRPGRDLQLICSHIEDLRPYLAAPLAIDWRYLTALLLRNFMPARRTGFEGVQEVLPGETVTIASQTSTGFHWSPARFWREPYRRPDIAARALRGAAEESVAFWAARHRHILVDLSGGLDSSAILGLLARLPAPPEITCLNAVVGHQESDERDFARAAASAAGTALREVDLSQTVPDYGEPVGDPLQPRPTPQLRRAGLDVAGLRLAREVGAQAYFTGRGGDHLFYNGLPLTAARDSLGGIGSLPHFPAAAMNVARATGASLADVVAATVAPPRSARDLRGLALGANPLVRREAAAALDAAEFVHPWALDALETAPLGKVRQVCLLIELQRHYDRIGRAAVLEEVHPFIAQGLIEASLRTPAYMFAEGGVRRGLQREVFRDVLPEPVLSRRTKGATTSHAIRILARNLPYLRERLLEGELVAEGLVDRAALEAQLTPTALLDGRVRPGLAECVSAQLWLDQTRSAGLRDLAAPRNPGPGEPAERA